MHCVAKLIPKKTAPLSDFIIGYKERRVKLRTKSHSAEAWTPTKRYHAGLRQKISCIVPRSNASWGDKSVFFLWVFAKEIEQQPTSLSSVPAVLPGFSFSPIATEAEKELQGVFLPLRDSAMDRLWWCEWSWWSLRRPTHVLSSQDVQNRSPGHWSDGLIASDSDTPSWHSSHKRTGAHSGNHGISLLGCLIQYSTCGVQPDYTVHADSTCPRACWKSRHAVISW